MSPLTEKLLRPLFVVNPRAATVMRDLAKFSEETCGVRVWPGLIVAYLISFALGAFMLYGLLS